MGLFGLFGGMGDFAPAIASAHSQLLAAGKGDGTVGILPMAHIVPVRSRKDAEQKTHADALVGASLILMHGGVAAWVVETLQDTPVWRTILDEVDRGASLIAISGGTMSLGEVVPVFNEDRSGHRWIPALRLFAVKAIGSHWDGNQFGGMRRAYVSLQPQDDVFAVDERTAAVGDGVNWLVHGVGSVHLLRGGREEHWGPNEKFQYAMRS